MDFHCEYPCDAEDSSEAVLNALGNDKFNVHPMLFEMGGAAAQDRDGFRSLGLLFLVQSVFGQLALGDITRNHMASYVDMQWIRWCSATLQKLGLFTETTAPSAQFVALLNALSGDPLCSFQFDPQSYRGVMSPANFLESYEASRPEMGDEAAERRTYIALLRIPAAETAAPDAPATPHTETAAPAAPATPHAAAPPATVPRFRCQF